jgi:exopolysaccharide biosynthesis polyprenyl glycosylphosphotransferase
VRSNASLLLHISPAIDASLMAAVFASFWTSSSGYDERVLLFANLIAMPAWLWALEFVGAYESQRVEKLSALVRKVMTASAIAAVPSGAIAMSLGGTATVLVLGRGMLALALLAVAEKLLVYSTLHALRKRGHDRRSVCVVGAWEWAQRIAARFDAHPDWGLQIACVGVGSCDHRLFVRYPDGQVLAPDLLQVLSTEVVDEVLVAVRPEELHHEAATLQTCEQVGVIGRVLLEIPERPAAPCLETFGGEVTLALGARPADGWSLVMKRLIDLMGALALAIALAPLLLATALVVKLSSKGPILFLQERVGLHGRRFKVFKFRTMVDGAEALMPSLTARSIMNGPIFKDPADLRVTPIGRVLRKFSLDELPQLFNVIRGDMSLVGPRPLPLHESAAIAGSFRRRFSMRPGITCLWQVNGRSNVDYTAWMNYDLQYVDRWSLWLDARLLLKTIPAVLSGRGAY